MKLALLSPMHLNAPTARPTPPTGGTLAPQTPDAFTPSTKLQRQGFDLSRGALGARLQARLVLEAAETVLRKDLKMNEDQYNKRLKGLLGLSYGECIESLNKSISDLKTFIENPCERTLPEDLFLPFAGLRGRDLRGLDLIGANLIGANLIGADLKKANLIKANLSNANLSNANLKKANLRGANLKDTNLKDTNLKGTNLLDAFGAPIGTTPNQLGFARDPYLIQEYLRQATMEKYEALTRSQR